MSHADAEIGDAPCLADAITGPELPPRFERLLDYLPYHAEHHPARPALVGPRQTITWSELPGRTAAVAKALIANGVVHGDRVAVWTPPSVDGILAFLACARIGAIFVGVNPKYQPPEVEHLLADASPTLLLGATQTSQRDYHEDLGRAAMLAPETRVVPFALGTGFAAFVSEAASVSDAALQAAADAVAPADPVTIVYTSGTTGKPKGALLTQIGFAGNYWHTYRERYTEWLRIPAFLTLNHAAGLGDVAALAVVAGGSQYFMERFDPAALLELIERERLNYVAGLVTHFQLLFRGADVDAYDLSSLEYIWWGGAQIPLDLLARLENLCDRVSTDYGQTETHGPLVYMPVSASSADKSRMLGLPRTSHPVRLADERGEVVPFGEAGEVQAYGSHLSPGYLNDPEASAALYTPDGWLRTGDLAVQRPDGYLGMVGRIKEMFKSGGYNVYPAEIESVIAEHPGVDMVAVLSVPDQVFQEVGWAFISPKRDARLEPEELRTFVSERIANYKVPKRFVVSRDLPRTAVGKIDKPHLRAQALRG
jgi:acyl-CoA synthetase (AMP-forming)/AMP-acid ligase II